MGLTQRLGTIPLAIQTDSSNNVGIGGAANASYKLAVTGASLFTGAGTFNNAVSLVSSAPTLNLSSTSATGINEIYFNRNTSSLIGYMAVGVNSTITGSGDEFIIDNRASGGGLIFRTNNAGTSAARLTIASTGAASFTNTIYTPNFISSDIEFRLGAPFARVATLDSGAGFGGGYNFNWNNASPIHNSTGTLSGYAYASDGTVRFYTDGSAAANTAAPERMRITSGGGVVVGSTLSSPTGFENGWWVKTTNDARAYFSSTREALSINRYNSTGDLLTFDYNGGGKGSISTNGSTISYNTGSDYRIKEDFKEVNGLEKVSAIKIYNFKFKGTDNIMDGVIAHELAEILPYAVNGKKDAIDEDGKMIIQGVDYSLIVPVLVKAIQELSAKVTALENK